MNITSSSQTNSNELTLPISAPPRTLEQGQAVPSSPQGHLSPSSLLRNHQPNGPLEVSQIPGSPILRNQGHNQQSKPEASSSEIGSSHPEAGPLPKKVGEIGYVPPAEPTRPPNLIPRDPSQHNELDVDLPTHPQYLRHTRSMPAWSPTISNSYDDDSSNNRGKPRERLTAFRMFLKPVLLVAFGIAVITVTLIGLIQVQDRINSNKKSQVKASSKNDDVASGNAGDSSDGAGTSNASFVYMGTFFIVALLVELWVLVGSLRRLYHRLGLWVDQEYSPQLPDLSDPEAIDTIRPPVLPLWAKVLGIRPQAVRKPLLPSYMAVLGIIRTGSRSESSRTVDIEDGEVIRSLAIGRGQAAPAFNGEEFQRSTVLLSGPPKRSNSTRSNASSMRSGGLLRSLGQPLTSGFSSRNSTNQTSGTGPTTGPNHRISVTSVTSNGRRISEAYLALPETAERVSNEHPSTVELSEVPVTQNAVYIYQSRRAA